jgi:hypothetical protein
MERLDPTPQRAIAFVQLQLSQVLSRLGYEDEAMRVLAKAVDFHTVKAREVSYRIRYLPSYRRPSKSTVFRFGFWFIVSCLVLPCHTLSYLVLLLYL